MIGKKWYFKDQTGQLRFVVSHEMPNPVLVAMFYASQGIEVMPVTTFLTVAK